MLKDTSYTSGFPQNFHSLHVVTNNGINFKYHWRHNGNLIDGNYKLSLYGRTTTYLVSDIDLLLYQGTYQFFMETPAGTIAGNKLKVEFTCKYHYYTMQSGF